MKTIKNYYKILGVERSATTQEIKETYRRLAKLYHPDLNRGSVIIQRKFQEITEAYNVLGNLDNRLKYSVLLNQSKNHLDEVKLADFMKRNGH